MRLYILSSLIIGLVTSQDDSQGMNCILSNTDGCKMIRSPTYLVVAPSKIRPTQVINVFVSALHLEYDVINIRVSIIKDKIDYDNKIAKFEFPGSKIIELMLPSNAMPGHYKMRVEGFLSRDDSGVVFFNETDVEFDKKQASIFIQIANPIYKKKQWVRFRVISLLPNLMPKYGSMAVSMSDPTDTTVKRWQGQQTNAGGFADLAFKLSDQPKFGVWNIVVDAYGYVYKKPFEVFDHHVGRFEINVTVPTFILSDATHIGGVLYSNQTSGKAVFGNATIKMTIIRAGEVYDKNTPSRNLSPLVKVIDYFENGLIDFAYTREEILTHADRGAMTGMEFLFDVTVYDWELMINKNAYGSSV